MKPIALLCLLFWATLAWNQDMVIRTNNDTLRGELLEITTDKIRFF